MLNATRLKLILVAVVFVMFALGSGCASKALQKNTPLLATLPAPTPMYRPLAPVLTDFGKMVRAYVTATGERDTVMAVDHIPNNTGLEKEMPTDVGGWVRQVIESVGKPFLTFQLLPPSALIKGPVASILPMMQNDHPKPPAAIYKVVGSLQRASERVVNGGDMKASVLAGNGHGSTDGQATHENRLTITSLTLALGLEQPNGLAVPGATTAYKIDVAKNEINHSFSLFVGGSGIGAGSRLTVTQDMGDALYDVTAAAIMHVLGNALMIPYYRCSDIFTVDEALDNRVRDTLNRLTRAELEQNVKRYLYLSGDSMDMRGPDLTSDDRAVVVVEMRQRSLTFADRAALVEFAFQLWKNLDFVKAAAIVDARMADSVQKTREKIAADAAREAEWDISPVQFGWPATVQMVLLDLTRVKDMGAREQILAVARTCLGCEEVLSNPDRTVAGVRLSSEPWRVQQALRSTRFNVSYAWAGVRTQRLCVIPK